MMPGSQPLIQAITLVQTFRPADTDLDEAQLFGFLAKREKPVTSDE